MIPPIGDAGPVVSVTRPDAGSWRQLPRRWSGARATTVAWLINLLVLVLAFVADRGWEDLDDATSSWDGPYGVLDVYGLAGTYLVVAGAAFVWTLGRNAVTMVPLVLASLAFPLTLDGDPVAGYFWAGTVVALGWSGWNALNSWRQLESVRTVGRAGLTGETVHVGPAAQGAVRRSTRRRWWILWAAVLLSVASWAGMLAVLPDELGLPASELEESSLSDLLAAVGLGTGMWACAQGLQHGWRFWSRRRVGGLVWEVPTGGPVWGFPGWALGGPGYLAPAAILVPGCICRAEHQRSYPGDPSGQDASDDEIEASNYCPEHGVDALNAMDPGEFRSRMGETWLWDMESEPPRGGNAGTSSILWFAGHAMTGIPVRRDGDRVETLSKREPPAEEWFRGEPAILGEDGENERPGAGELDRIDLGPVGCEGWAIRYRHGRAWYVERPERS